MPGVCNQAAQHKKKNKKRTVLYNDLLGLAYCPYVL
jgi:hypothetical protein